MNNRSFFFLDMFSSWRYTNHRESTPHSSDIERLFNDDREKPNALFLFREHHDGISHAVWRVYDAEKVEAVLQKIIEDKQHPREFDYEMEYDEDWKLVEWYLQDFHNK